MTTQLQKPKTYTVEEYMDLPDDGKRYELIEGELIEMPGPSYDHGTITSDLIGALRDFLKSKGQSPRQAVTNMAFALGPKTAVVPDVAYVATEKATNIDKSKAFPGAPDLAIEIISPTDKWSEIIAKVKQYQNYKVTLIWVVDPFDQSISIFRPNQNRRLLFSGDNLSGEEILPGFTLPVKDLFP